MFGGIRIIENALLVDSVEDWSRVRSPSRARRRMRYGHRQNVRIVSKPRTDVLVVGTTWFMHPMTADLLRKQLQERRDVAFVSTMYGGVPQ